MVEEEEEEKTAVASREVKCWKEKKNPAVKVKKILVEKKSRIKINRTEEKKKNNLKIITKKVEKRLNKNKKKMFAKEENLKGHED